MKTKQQITTYLEIWEESLQKETNDFEAGKTDYDTYRYLRAIHKGHIHALKYVLENN